MASYSLNARLTTIETKISNVDSTFYNIHQCITSIEDKIKQIEEGLQQLQYKYEENNRLLNSLQSKVGQKRKWWQMT